MQLLMGKDVTQVEVELRIMDIQSEEMMYSVVLPKDNLYMSFTDLHIGTDEGIEREFEISLFTGK